MGEAKPLVTFELCQLEGTTQRYVIYSFAPRWRVEDLRAATALGLVAISQVPMSEKLESIFQFSEWETFDSVNLLSEMRKTFSDPNNARFVYTSAVGLEGFARNLLESLLGIARRVYHDKPTIGFYSTLEEALIAMRQRVEARKEV